MQSEDIKTSGILESYALGLTSEEEKKQVELMIQQNPSLKEELNSIYQSLENYALAHSRQPAADLKSKIFNKIVFSKQENKTKVVQLTGNSTGNFSLKMLLAASISLFFLSAAVNFFLYSKWQNAKDRTFTIEKEKEVVADQFLVQKASYNRLSVDYSLMTDPRNKMIVMKGVEKHAADNSIVFWNSASHEVFVSITSLPEPPHGKQYQLWALKDGKPIDAGVFDYTRSLQKLKAIESADSFAVTLEDAGGKSSPSLDQLFVLAHI